MKNVVLIAAIFLALGCDDDGTSGGGGSGGNAGAPGTGGASSSGGTPGTGGTGGTGGSAGTGGSGGTGGTGGTGGSTGTGGVTGMAGGGGNGGTGGVAGGGGNGGVAEPNICPMLFVINLIPRDIPLGETTTIIETRARDIDGLPFPLVLTLRALWGSFENTVNIQEPNNVVAQNATYICDRRGEVEICVDATDGACLKTLCDDVTCPVDTPAPP